MTTKRNESGLESSPGTTGVEKWADEAADHLWEKAKLPQGLSMRKVVAGRGR